MLKKAGALICILIAFVIFSGGCETTKGVAQSVSCAIDNTAHGAKKDVKGIWEGMLTLDSWMKDELW